ncbi:MAG: exodeoxyribonuclease VII large subunit [Cyclobacteriaceae bacterium]
MESYSLLEFNQLIKSTLDEHLEKSYWIVAEIGEMNINRSGHCYLDLIEKDGNTIAAKTRATIWSYTFSSLSNWFANATGQNLSSGMKVMLNAAVQYHEVYGFSLNVKDIDPNYTLGERERKKQETINNLEADGIIGMNKTVPLPLVPQRIAVISSETAAGFGDFKHQLENNPYSYSVHLQLFNSVMQGSAAVESILQALHRVYELEDEFDLVVLIRGGGAQTDLDCFDDFDLCAHLAQFPLPIVTGIGHERDSTIADLVANTKMKTPTAVAEFIINGMIEFESRVNEAFEQIKNIGLEKVNQNKERINYIHHQIKLNAQSQIHQAEIRLSTLQNQLLSLPQQLIKLNQAKLDLAEKTIAATDPAAILKRGFTITRVNGKFLSNKTSPKTGDIVETQSEKGKFESTVN